MKKILIDAVMIGNLGDDLFVKILADRYEKTFFSVLIPKEYSAFLSECKNVKSINYDFSKRFTERVSRKLLKRRIIFNVIQKKHDATVLISGSAFMQQNDFFRQAAIYNNDIENTKNYYMLGINFGPFTDERFVDLFDKTYSMCSDVCFRENYSYQMFKHIESVRYAPDIVFSLDMKEYIGNKINKSVGISVIDLSNRENLKKYQEDYEKAIIKVIAGFIESGYTVNLYSFCKVQGDEVCIERLMNQIDIKYKDSVNAIYYNGNLQEIIQHLSKEEIIIATRFHAMILGWKLRKKVFPITYSNKMVNVIKDLNFDGNYCDMSSVSSLSHKMIIDTSKKLERIEEIEKESGKQFQAVDFFINEDIC